MEGNFKSPISSRSINRSRANLSKSVNVAKHSQYKQQSESKNHIAKCKEVADRQTYKNILNKLLRIPTLNKFVREAEKYVDLSEEIVGQFKSYSEENEKRRQ
jgi:predicted transcriptional regulator